jgi:predicted RND superfamily exporter protein
MHQLVEIPLLLTLGFAVGVCLAGNVKEEIHAAHEKLDAILAAVRRH